MKPRYIFILSHWILIHIDRFTELINVGGTFDINIVIDVDINPPLNYQSTVR